jgi:uncharacterized alpha-E superfamily protein
MGAKMISVNSALSLYWLGRYMQRAETTAKECINSFDYIVDKDFDDGKKLFAKLDIDISYKDERGFLHEAIFGEHSSSIYSSMYDMKENSVRCRDQMHSHAFAYVNKAYIGIKELRTQKLEVFHLEELLSNLYGLDGVLNSTLIKSEAANLIEFGKRVERIDLEVRLFDNLTVVLFELDELYGVGKLLCKEFKKPNITTNNKEKLLTLANSLVKSVIKF